MGSYEICGGTWKTLFSGFCGGFFKPEYPHRGKVFPKGCLAVAVMNYGKEVTTQLLYAGAACYQAVGSILADTFSIDQFRKVKQEVYAVCDKTRLNTINKHLERGKIDEEFASKAKELAHRLLVKARRSAAYLREQYPKDISQEGLYAAVTAELGRPPRQREG